MKALAFGGAAVLGARAGAVALLAEAGPAVAVDLARVVVVVDGFLPALGLPFDLEGFSVGGLVGALLAATPWPARGPISVAGAVHLQALGLFAVAETFGISVHHPFLFHHVVSLLPCGWLLRAQIS